MYKNKVIRILTIDPGLSKLGWVIIDYDLKNNIAKIVLTGEISSNNQANRVSFKKEVEMFGLRLISLNLLEGAIEDLINQYMPQYITCEDAFFNKKFPNAYLALTQTIYVIERLIFKKFHKKLFKIPTRLAKMVLAGHGDSKKKNIQDIVKNHPNIQFKHKKEKRKISDHIADAIAVGYTFIVEILPGLLNKKESE